MTEKLYYENSHLYNFDAVVKDIIKDKKNTLIVLDKTAFFPEGGGQYGDEGLIDGIKITDVFIKNEIIYHQTSDNVTLIAGDKVSCSVNAALRFQRMQSHSGEHIVSGIAHNLYGADNVGFHMDKNHVMTVDFNIKLSEEQIEFIETSANEKIYQNLPVKTYILNHDEAEKIEYRSKKDFPDDVRIVDIEGVDRCACCAPHVTSTGEIGLIKILSCISHRGGVRLTLICGKTALYDYQQKYRQTLNISAYLCAKHSETDIAVSKLIEQNNNLKYSIKETKSAFNRYLASEIPPSPVICAGFSGLIMNDLYEIGSILNEKCGYCAFVYSGDDNKGYNFCLYSDKLNLDILAADMRTRLNCKGGGRGGVIQGSVRTTKENITDFFNTLEVAKYADA